mmetsp:Transcript_17449/g.52355  ORF Transcript_17449/g.52355 Transcript_17449/m.52355 type:complete len:146 (-) Transcript_17449:1783-2220(-)
MLGCGGGTGDCTGGGTTCCTGSGTDHAGGGGNVGGRFTAEVKPVGRGSKPAADVWVFWGCAGDVIGSADVAAATAARTNFTDAAECNGRGGGGAETIASAGAEALMVAGAEVTGGCFGGVKGKLEAAAPANKHRDGGAGVGAHDC